MGAPLLPPTLVPLRVTASTAFSTKGGFFVPRLGALSCLSHRWPRSTPLCFLSTGEALGACHLEATFTPNSGLGVGGRELSFPS